MDVDLLKTFIELYQTKHFGKTAETLHLTTAGVSSRIKHLEEQLNCPLFTRDRNNIQPTSAGEALLSYAKTILENWDNAKISISEKNNEFDSLKILTSPGFWDSHSSSWVNQLLRDHENLQLELETLNNKSAFQQLLNIEADLYLSFESFSHPQILSEEIGQLALVLAESKNNQRGKLNFDFYIHVNWSQNFHTQVESINPELRKPLITVSTARVAQDLLRHRGGCAFLSKSMIAKSDHLISKDSSKDFELRIYAYYRKSDKSELIQRAITLLKEGISKEIEPSFIT